MKVEPRRSKYKKITTQYYQDNVLDIIDIEDTLSKNRFIPKANEDNFIYAKYLEKTQNTFLSLQFKEIPSTINYANLNNNKFNIDFKVICLEYPNGYSILLTDVYYLIEIIGEGSFGVVVSAINRKTNHKEAIKIISKRKFSPSEKETIDNEVKILNSLNSPRVMKIYEVLDTDNYFFIFMELIEGGSLRDLIISRYKNDTNYLFQDSECSMIMNGILESLNYIHKNRIVHRDIKPENIMLKIKDDLSSITLCDFGIAYKLTNGCTEGQCGTALFMAPEIVSNRKYDHLVDSWSAGIILYTLVSGGEHPYYKKTMTQVEYEEELLKKNPIKFSDHIPLLARNLFFKLCKYEPFYRYEPYKALKHPWITRSKKSQIPMTLVEEYQMEGKIKEFKSMLSTTLFFNMYKNIYQLQLKQKEEDKLNNSGSSFKINSSRKGSESSTGNKGIMLHVSKVPSTFAFKRPQQLSHLKKINIGNQKKILLSRNSKKQLPFNLNQSSGDNSQLSTSSNPNHKPLQIELPTKKKLYLKTESNVIGGKLKLKSKEKLSLITIRK